MKKFLSILLAVMMVLSTVSFAAPSLAGTADTAVEAPVADAPAYEEAEPVADLAATAGDESTYGKLIVNIDFENFNVGDELLDHQYLNTILDADDYDSAFGGNYWINWEVGANAIAQETNGNKYIRGGQGWSQVRIENQKYGYGAPDGVYTVVMDAIDFGSTARKVGPVTQESYVQGVKVKSEVVPTALVEWEGNLGKWQTVAAEWDGVSNNMSVYFTDGATTEVGFDNIKIYYRPSKVTLTIDGNEYEVSTDNPVSATSLASQVKAPTGYVLSGLSLTEGGELLTGERYFFEDTTLYATYAKDPNIDPEYGKALYVVDFENEAAQNWWGHSYDDNSYCTAGGHIDAIASYYDPMFVNQNYRIRFLINEATHIDQKTVVDENGNHFTQGKAVSKWPQISLSNYQPITGEAGIYTFVVDTMTDTTVENFSHDAAWTEVDPFSKKVGEWDTVVVQQTMTEAGTFGHGAPVIYYTFPAAGATVSFDNAKLYYKPLKADVTLIYKGEEYVAEDVATSGVSADTIVEAAGLDIPYGKKAVLSATNGGESVGNTINLIMDSTYYVSFVDDDSISEYGKRLFLIDFENLPDGELADKMAISTYTDNYNGDWAHLTINWAVGNETATVSTENGNKIVKGTQGWAQVRINNEKYETAPDGYYTMALKVKNYGNDEKFLATKDQNSGEYAIWVKAGSVTGTKENYPIVNGEWNEVASQLDYASQDFTIYHTANMTTDVAFDDIALYYRPAKVNLTVVDIDGDEIVYEDCNSVVDIDTLLEDVTAPFGYKPALSIEKNGEPITGSINLVSDAKLYVVLVEDETVSLEYGKALAIVDFEREDMQGWAGTTQEIANTTVASGAYINKVATYYDESLFGPTTSNDNKYNSRIRFVINETEVTDQKTVVDENGNHYTTGTATTRWPQVMSSNYGNVQGGAGTYTYMFDVKIEATTETNLAMGNGTIPNVESIDPFSAKVGEWDTVVVQTTLASAGNIPSGTWSNFNFTASNTTTLSFDNAKIYYKPLTATVKVVANGEVVATKENVSTAGVVASTLTDGVKVKGYTITGVKLGTTEYALTDTVNIPCDCQVELVLEEQPYNPATPETSEETSIRVEDPMGIRFKASLLAENKAETVTTSYGWVVARADVLGDDELTLEYENKVVGYGREDGVDMKKFFFEDDDYAWFTGVLYFSKTEDDGLPSADKLVGKLIARPFAVVDGETLYGEPTAPTSMYDVAVALWSTGDGNDPEYEGEDLWNALDQNKQTYLDNLMIKAEESGLLD